MPRPFDRLAENGLRFRMNAFWLRRLPVNGLKTKQCEQGISQQGLKISDSSNNDAAVTWFPPVAITATALYFGTWSSSIYLLTSRHLKSLPVLYDDTYALASPVRGSRRRLAVVQGPSVQASCSSQVTAEGDEGSTSAADRQMHEGAGDTIGELEQVNAVAAKPPEKLLQVQVDVITTRSNLCSRESV